MCIAIDSCEASKVLATKQISVQVSCKSARTCNTCKVQRRERICKDLEYAQIVQDMQDSLLFCQGLVSCILII